MNRESGFSLLELMISLVILAFIIAGVFQSFTVQHKTYVLVDQVTEAQQNLRAVSDLMERDIRVAGYMVPPAAAACGFDGTVAPDTLFLSNADAIGTVAQLEAIDPDLLSGNMGVDVTNAGAAWGWAAGSGSSVSVSLSQLWVDVAGTADFALNGGIIVTDLNDANGATACGQITAISDAANPSNPQVLTVNFGPGAFAASGSPDVVAVPAHRYAIVPAAGNVPAQLFRNNQLFANDVEDLQVVWYFDSDDDRIIDANEVVGDAGTGTYPPLATINKRRLIELRVSLVSVTRDEDPNQNAASTRTPQTANRTAASLAGSADRRRRRLHETTVRLRNLG